MAQPQSIGPYQVRNRQDLPAAIDEINAILRLLVPQLDERKGFRGPIDFHDIVNMRGNVVKKVGTPSDFDDAQQFGLSLSMRGGAFDAKGHRIVHVRPGIESSDAATFGQIEDVVAASQIQGLSNNIPLPVGGPGTDSAGAEPRAQRGGHIHTMSAAAWASPGTIGTTAPNTVHGNLYRLRGAFGQYLELAFVEELTSVANGVLTQATTIQIPADAIVMAVPVRVTVQPGGTVTMTVTATTSLTAFQKGANISTATGTTDPGSKNTPVNYNGVAAQTVTFTFNAATTDAAGRIRTTIVYWLSVAPTS